MSGDVTTTELTGLDATTDPATLLNVIERLVARVASLEEALGRALDENNRLNKGDRVG